MRATWWWIDRWRKSTAYTDMTAEEQGLYRNLIDEIQLRHDGVIPDRSMGRASGDAVAWERCKGVVLRWMRPVEGGWTNSTALEVKAEGERRSEAQRLKAEKRWESERRRKNAAACAAACAAGDAVSDARAMPQGMPPSPSPSPYNDTTTPPLPPSLPRGGDLGVREINSRTAGIRDWVVSEGGVLQKPQRKWVRDKVASGFTDDEIKAAIRRESQGGVLGQFPTQRRM